MKQKEGRQLIVNVVSKGGVVEVPTATGGVEATIQSLERVLGPETAFGLRLRDVVSKGLLSEEEAKAFIEGLNQQRMQDWANQMLPKRQRSPSEDLIGCFLKGAKDRRRKMALRKLIRTR